MHEGIEPAVHGALDLLREHPLIFSVLFGGLFLLFAIAEWFWPAKIDIDKYYRSDKDYDWGIVIFFGIVSAVGKASSIWLAAVVLYFCGVKEDNLATTLCVPLYIGFVMVGISKTQSRFLKQPSLAQSAGTIAVFLIALILWSWLIGTLLEVKASDEGDGWALGDYLVLIFSVLGLALGWAVPPSARQED